MVRIFDPKKHRISREAGNKKTVYSPALGVARGAITVWGILGPGFRIRLLTELQQLERGSPTT